MHPIICQIGPFTIYSYGAMLAVAVLACAFLLTRESQQTLGPNEILDLIFWVVLGGIIGGRLFFILLNLSFFSDNPSEILMLHHGGLAWQGALILGTVCASFFIRKKKLPIGKTLDILAPYIALGQSIGRIGCFLNGCCYGKEVAWGIFFPVHHARLHPAQLYDSFGLLVIFFLLKKYRTSKHRDGKVFILYLILSSSLRFAVEFFRADHITIFAGLSIFQIVSLSVITLAVYAHLRLKS